MIRVLVIAKDGYGFLLSAFEQYINKHPFTVTRDQNAIRLRDLKMVFDPAAGIGRRIASFSLELVSKSWMADTAFPGITFEWTQGAHGFMSGSRTSPQYFLAYCHNPILSRYFWELLREAAEGRSDIVTARMIETAAGRLLLGDEQPLVQLATEASNALNAELPDGVPLRTNRLSRDEMLPTLEEVLTAAGIGPRRSPERLRTGARPLTISTLSGEADVSEESADMPTADVMKRIKPKEPSNKADLDYWFAWYHNCKAVGYKVTLNEIADRTSLSYDYVRERHAEYKKRMKIGYTRRRQAQKDGK